MIDFLKDKITFCLMYCGEETLEECLDAVKDFDVIFQEVRNVVPQAKALNQMLSQVNTEYLVPLDADMILNKNALNRIKEAIYKYESDPEWHSILFPLWDTFTSRKILALKVLRMKIIKDFYFSDTRTPDIEHFDALRKAGYNAIVEYLDYEPIGLHKIQGKHFVYMKYRDVFQTYRKHRREWDSALFFSPNLDYSVQKYFELFIFNRIMKSDDSYLWALAGMMDGLTSPLVGSSKDLSDTIKIDKDEALDAYFEWLARLGGFHDTSRQN